MMVNPSGVQLDMLQQLAAARISSPDWIWDSAGRVTRDRLHASRSACRCRPSASRAATNIRMGILFWRRVSRTGYRCRGRRSNPDEWVFEHARPLVFDHLRGRD